MTVRSELKDHLAGEISDVVVYDHPAENPSVPSIGMVPRDPYIIPKSFGKSGAPGTIGIMLGLYYCGPLRPRCRQAYELDIDRNGGCVERTPFSDLWPSSAAIS